MRNLHSNEQFPTRHREHGEYCLRSLKLQTRQQPVLCRYDLRDQFVPPRHVVKLNFATWTSARRSKPAELQITKSILSHSPLPSLSVFLPRLLPSNFYMHWMEKQTNERNSTKADPFIPTSVRVKGYEGKRWLLGRKTDRISQWL